MKYGAKGYGIYFMIIEILRDAVEYKISSKNIDSIIYEIREDKEIIIDIIKNYDLFVIDKDFFYSKSLKRRMSFFDEKKKKRSKAGKKGMKKRWDSSLQKHNDVITPLYQSYNNDITPLYQNDNDVITSKVKESKVNKKESVKRKKFTKPKLSEIHSYFKFLKAANPKEISERFENYYESNGWKVGKNKMVSWKHTVANWLKDENNKSKSEYVDESRIEYEKKKARRERDMAEKSIQNAISDDEKQKILSNVNFKWD